MEFQKVLTLRGPNIWANFPVLEAWVDLGVRKDSPSNEMPGFNDRLTAWLPSLVEHRCSVGERGGFFERLRRGTYLAHILEHVTLELQTLAGTPVGFGRARETAREGVYRVAIEYEEEEIGHASLHAARELCLAAIDGRPFDVAAVVRQLRELAGRVCLDVGTAAIVRAARKRKIPARRLAGGLVQLGYGARQRRVWGAQTDETGAVAAAIAADVETSRTVLKATGVPVPEGRQVRDADDAWAAAEEVGTPVVVRRRYGQAERNGDGCASREQVVAAYEALAEKTSSIVVERCVAGPSWRVLVVGGQVAAACRWPAPAHANGCAGDVADRLHPEVAARAVEATRAVGLDLAGVDLVAEDIGRPLEDQGGAVVAVTAQPDLAIHLQPAAGTPRPVGEAVVAALFPEGETGRIPVVGVTGVNGKTTTTRLIAHILGRARYSVGMTCTEGIYVAGRRIEAGDCSGPKSARAVLQNHAVEAAVFETARGGILREGLGFDRCDVAVVTNIGQGDHLGIGAIDTPEQLAVVKRSLVEVVAKDGVAVLNADDPLVTAMAAHCRGAVVYFARDDRHPVLVRHRAEQGRAAFVRDGRLVLAEGGQEIPLVTLEKVPLTHGGRIDFQVENALAAAAAAWALGVPCEAIRAGLESFASDLSAAPGRFNLIEVNGAVAVLDYGHNVSSLARLIEALDQFPHGRRVAVYSAAGDRRDGDMLGQAELLANAFDRVILYEDDNCTRGRKDGEIAGVFRRGMAKGSRVQEIDVIRGAVRAVEAAIDAARPGELLLVQVDLVDETIALVRRNLGTKWLGRETSLAEVLEATQVPVAPAV